MMKQIPRIVSGGQSGADRAALDWALSHNLPCGGWCDGGKEILVPYPTEMMKASAISLRVNSPKNDDAGIMDPVVVSV
jgi:hypothetical protein